MLIKPCAAAVALSFHSLRIWGSNQTYKSYPEIACFFSSPAVEPRKSLNSPLPLTPSQPMSLPPAAVSTTHPPTHPSIYPVRHWDTSSDKFQPIEVSQIN